MSVLPMRIVPDRILGQRAKRVNTINASVQRLIDDMIDTLHDAVGVGAGSESDWGPPASHRDTASRR